VVPVAAAAAASAPVTNCVSASVNAPVDLRLPRALLVTPPLAVVVMLDPSIEALRVPPLRLPRPPRLLRPPRVPLRPPQVPLRPPRVPLRVTMDACTTCTAVSRPFIVLGSLASSLLRSTPSYYDGSRRIDGAKLDWRCVLCTPLPRLPLDLLPLLLLPFLLTSYVAGITP
jgi:hypothetical protein